MSTGTRQNQELLVWGYVRENERAYKIRNMPLDINKVIYLYLKLCDEWNVQHSSQNMKIDKTRSIIHVKTSYATAYGDTVVSQGKFVWRLQISSPNDDDTETFESPYIGIIEDKRLLLKKYRDSAKWDMHGYQLLAGGDGSIYTRMTHSKNDKTRKYQCVWMEEGDILEMTLDLNHRTLSFKVNDKDFGIGVSDIKQTKYRLALTLDKYEFHSKIALL